MGLAQLPMPLKLFDFPLTKAMATGNDFLLVDLLDPALAAQWKKDFGHAKRADLVKAWCDRYTGLGADGVVILEPDPSTDFVWDFYNSDGSTADMCGNAARAVGLYVSEKTGRNKLKFNTRIGVISVRVQSPNDIEVELPEIKEEDWGSEFDFIRAGVPHVVIKCDSLDNIAQLTTQALAIKKMLRFAKDGTNVTFLRIITPNHIQTKTFERGVEGFTRSCGTGAIAAAHSILRGKENQPLQVDVPGGRLSVVWKEGKPTLRGPARIIGEMHWMRDT